MKNAIIMIFFMLAILLLYIGVNAGVYKYLLHYFPLLQAHKKTLLASIVLLGAGFFITSFVTHIFNNAFNRFLYEASGIWIGFLLNLFFVFVLGSLLYLLLGKMNMEINRQVFGLVLLLFSVVYSAYGVWNAFNPVVKEIKVPLKNLPDNWKGKKVVQISDIHLGYIYREKAIENMVAKINQIKPEAIFVTGDLLDGSDGDLSWLEKPLKEIAAPAGVFFVTGNHETYLGPDEALGVLNKTNFVQLHDRFVNANGLQIIGIDYPQRGQQKDIVLAVQKTGFDPNNASVLLYHAPVQIPDIAKTGVGLQLSGHTHVGQIFPFELITKLIFKGYDYGLHQIGDYFLYTTNGVGTWGPAMRTLNRPEIVSITLE